jgi:Xaa-Pro dipeptidase
MEYVLSPKSEIDSRIKTLQSQMGDMDGALLFHAVDVCYFPGPLRTAWSTFLETASPWS